MNWRSCSLRIMEKKSSWTSLSSLLSIQAANGRAPTLLNKDHYCQEKRPRCAATKADHVFNSAIIDWTHLPFYHPAEMWILVMKKNKHSWKETGNWQRSNDRQVASTKFLVMCPCKAHRWQIEQTHLGWKMLPVKTDIDSPWRSFATKTRQTSQDKGWSIASVNAGSLCWINIATLVLWWLRVMSQEWWQHWESAGGENR